MEYSVDGGGGNTVRGSDTCGTQFEDEAWLERSGAQPSELRPEVAGRKHREGVARTKFPDSGGAPESPAGAVQVALV